MKTTIFFLLALVAIASCANTIQKVDMSGDMMARVTSEALLGTRADCEGLCLVHFTGGDVKNHFCRLGFERASCESDEYEVGPRDGCYCCVPLPS